MVLYMTEEFTDRKLKSPSSGPRYMLMLQIDRGEKFPIPFRASNLSSNTIVATIDEYNNSIYLWFGKDCGEINKKLALNSAQSIKKIGYVYGQLHIGNCLKDLKIVDESNLSDKETQNNYLELKIIFKRESATKDQFLVEVVSKLMVVPKAQPAEQEAFKPTESELQTTVSESFTALEPPSQ
jgi:hypothetical protein